MYIDDVFVGSQYKEVCWKLEERGSVGETPLHVCLLNATSIHADLAKRLLHHYPKLINDFYVSDEYYGKLFLFIMIDTPLLYLSLWQQYLFNWYTRHDIQRLAGYL